MIVIDSSIFIDYLFEKDKIRNTIAKEFFYSLQDTIVYVPKLAFIEIISLGKRFGLKITREILEDLFKDVEVLSEEDIFDEAFKIAENIHLRAIDAYLNLVRYGLPYLYPDKSDDDVIYGEPEK